MTTDTTSIASGVIDVPALGLGYFLLGDEVKRGVLVLSTSTDPDYADNPWQLWSEDGKTTLQDVWTATLVGKDELPAFASPSRTYRMPSPPVESSTIGGIEQELLHENELAQRFELFVHDAENERFEDGMDSEFAARVHESIVSDGSVAVAAWERILLRMGNQNEAGEELLRQLGLIEHELSHSKRLRVLTDSLKSPSARIRDAAGLGLSFLDDQSALPALEAAHASEAEEWVKNGLKLVIGQFGGDG